MEILIALSCLIIAPIVLFGLCCCYDIYMAASLVDRRHDDGK